MKCGLLGERLVHSYSPEIHRLLGDYSYELLEKKPSEVEAFLRHGDFSGLNVTIPYKKTVIPYLDELTETAQKLLAVNTIIRRRDGTLLGHNTDYFGFSSMVEGSGLSVKGKKALVLGSGGASATAVAVLTEMGAQVVVISRQGNNNYHNLFQHCDAKIIVNATPVGMYPSCGVSPVDLALFPQLEGVLDMIYNPASTKLLLDARSRGLVAINGLWMLVAQAKESAVFFTGTLIAEEKIEEVYRSISRRMENIVLIGMPGCGKSTIGALLSEKLGRKFVDTDLEIQRIANKSIPEIFAQDGEAVFRQLESDVLQHFGKESSLVIATGGGSVVRPENHIYLRQNSRIFYLQRDLSKLPTDGRPLSVDLEFLFSSRSALYESLADQIVDNNGSIENTLIQIRKEYP